MSIENTVKRGKTRSPQEIGRSTAQRICPESDIYFPYETKILLFPGSDQSSRYLTEIKITCQVDYLINIR